MKFRLIAAGLVGLVLLSLIGIGGRSVWCIRKVDGESIGGFPAETFGEYQDAVEEKSGGCTEVVLIGLEGTPVDDPDRATPIEPVTGESRSAPITVYERDADDAAVALDPASVNALGDNSSNVRCYSDSSLPDGSSWIIEFSGEGDTFASLESIPSTDEFGEPSTHRRLALGQFDGQLVANVRIVGVPRYFLYALESWDMSGDTVRRPNFEEPGQDRIAVAIDCAEVDLDAALTTLSELRRFSAETESEIGIVDGESRRVATMANHGSDRLEVFVDFPGANTGSITGELNNLLATGRTVVVEGIEFSEVVAPRVNRVSSTFWIDSALLVPSAALNEIAISGGVAIGVLENSASSSSLEIEGIEFPIAEAVVVETATMLSRPYDVGIEMLEQARDAGLLDTDRPVQITVDPDGQVVGLLIYDS